MNISPTQMEALHTLAGGRERLRNTATAKALAAKGLVEKRVQDGSRYSRLPIDRWTDLVLTDAGRAAHDAFYTPEKLAADQAADEAAKARKARELELRRERLEMLADERNAAGARLAELLNGVEVGYPFKQLVGEQNARPHHDLSGISGGDLIGARITSTQLLAFAEAVLAAQKES